MGKYLLKRILHGIISVIIVVAIVILLVFSLIDKENVFKTDQLITKKQSNERITYKYQCWENYGYLDYITYTEYLQVRLKNGDLTSDEYKQAAKLGYKFDETGSGYIADDDNEMTKIYVKDFADYYTSKGYTVVRKAADISSGTRLKAGGAPVMFVYRNTPVLVRVWKFFTSIIQIDSIHYSERNTDDPVETRE